MTKNFCDLCGEPAISVVQAKIEFQDKTWSGIKTVSGSISCVSGTWTPCIEARLVFDMHNSERSCSSFRPDICPACAIKILDKIKENLTLSQKT